MRLEHQEADAAPAQVARPAGGGRAAPAQSSATGRLRGTASHPGRRRGRVESAKALLAQAAEALPEGMTLLQARRIARAPLAAAAQEQANRSEQTGALRLRLLTTALDVYLDRFFRNAKDGRIFVEMPAADPR